VEGDWRRLHNVELHDLYTSPNLIRLSKSRRTRGAGHVARMTDKKCIQNLCRKSRKKRSLGRPRHKWEDGIIMDLRETGWEGVDWIHLAQDRDQCHASVNTVMNLRVP
jgi:hypothetical protein